VKNRWPKSQEETNVAEFSKKCYGSKKSSFANDVDEDDDDDDDDDV
jgi:hypothetical protein